MPTGRTKTGPFLGKDGEALPKRKGTTLPRESVENATITGHFGLCLRKTRAAKSRDYRYVIDFERLCFHNIFRPHENAKTAFSLHSTVSRMFSKSGVFVMD